MDTPIEKTPKKKKKSLLQRLYSATKYVTAASLFCASAALLEQSYGYTQHYIAGKVEEVLSQKKFGNTASNTASGQLHDYIQSLSLPSLEEVLHKLEYGRNEGDILIVDRENHPLAHFTNFSKHANYEDISSKIIWSVIAAEDIRFNYHQGWDIGSLTMAITENTKDKLQGRHVHPRGASGITHQLADILLPDDADWKKTKIKEWIYATWLEQTFTKQEIITDFLNLTYFGYSPADGQHIVGISAAAEHYFGKPAAEVDWTEAVTLASMIKKPTSYGTKALAEWQEGKMGKYLEGLQHRAQYILHHLSLLRPQENIPFSDREYDETAQRLRYDEFNFHLEASTAAQQNQQQNQYVAEVMKRLYVLNGHSETLPGQTIVHTTIDTKLQGQAERLFKDSLDELRGKSTLPHPELLNGAIVVLDTNTLNVLAMVGGDGDYLNRATRNYLRPGSAFKPLILALALDKHIAALQDQFMDAPMTFYLPDGPLNQRIYTPQNYHQDWTYQPMTLEKALVHSKNTIFVQLNEKVMDTLGRKAISGWLEQLGIHISLYSLSSVLGPQETSLLDLAGAFMIFPNHGQAYHAAHDTNARFITGIEHNGKIEIPAGYQIQIIAPATSVQMDAVLRNVVEEGTGKAAQLNGYDLRGKTGTSQWGSSFIGYEPAMHALVAAQFSSDEPQLTGDFPQQYTGGKIVAPLVKAIFEYLHSQ